MKTILFFFLSLFLCCTSSICQSGFAIEPEVFDENFNENLTGNTFFNLQGHMQNSDSVTLSLNWEIVNIDIPEDWKLSVSDKYISYVPGITSNELPVDLDPEETEVIFTVHLYPNQIVGCGSWEVLITLDGAPSEVIDTIQYEASVNNDGCMVSNVNNVVEIDDIRLSPNPFTDVIHLKSEKNIQRLTIYDSNGSVVFKEMGSAIKRIAPQLISGLYLVQMEMENGSFVMQKILRQ